jgi:hypothetical protein
MLTCASSIFLASGLINRPIKPSASIASYQAFILIFAIVAIVVIIIVFRKYKGFLQTGRVINAGNAESGSTIRSPRFNKALKKPARYAAVSSSHVFIMNQHDTQWFFANASLFCSAGTIRSSCSKRNFCQFVSTFVG